jgi:hypothetical protein
MKTYSKRLNASTQLRLIHDDGLAAKVLERACDEIQQHPQSLPRWAFRTAQWVNRGRLGYTEVWGRIQRAAMSGGADEAWVTRVLYRSFADAIARRSEPMPLSVLAGGLH